MEAWTRIRRPVLVDGVSIRQAQHGREEPITATGSNQASGKGRPLRTQLIWAISAHRSRLRAKPSLALAPGPDYGAKSNGK